MAPFHSYIKLPGSSDEKTSSPQRGFHSVSRFLFSTVGDTWLRCKAVVAWQQLWNGGWVIRATHTTSPPSGAGTCGANIHHIAGICIGYGSKCLFTKWTSTCTLFWPSKCTRVLNHTSSSTWLKDTQHKKLNGKLDKYILMGNFWDTGIIRMPQLSDFPYPGWCALALATWRRKPPWMMVVYSEVVFIYR
jgi:hypothetical protein